MSEKNRDVKNRWRTVTVAFRLSPEENEELTNRVKMCGCRTRQEYIIQSILHQKVVATGNPLMLVSFRQNLQHIEAELERLQKVDEMDSELLTNTDNAGDIGGVSRNASYSGRYGEADS